MRTKPQAVPWTTSAVVVVILALLGCEAAAPRGSLTMTLPTPKAIEPADLKGLAGKWTGSGKSPAGTAQIETILSEDGSFYSVGSLTGDQRFPGRMQIREGKVFYETTFSSGTMTFHELSDQWVWKWEGKTKDGGPVANELVKARLQALWVYERDGIKVTTFVVDHGDVIKPAVGFKIEYDGHSVVISGDTRLSEEVVRQATGADLLIHEVSVIDPDLLKRSPAFQPIFAHHTSPEQAGTVFTRART